MQVVCDVLSKKNYEKETELAFNLYLFYLVSFFLHIPSRINFLGAIRLDFLLVGLIVFLIMSSASYKGSKLDLSSRYLISIFLYSIFCIPFVKWPGSVISNGLIEFIKGAIFYFFTVNLILSEKRLKILLVVFVSCNLIRVFEPLFLHLTEGYMGSRTYLGSGDFAGRLSGAPSDTINSNGLAFVIATIFPFLHYVLSPINKKSFLVYIAVVPVLLYVMSLTLSRSGMLALGIIAFGIFFKSKRKALLIILGVVGISIMWMSFSGTQKDRYLSIVSDDTRSSASAEGRIDSFFKDLGVAMNRPIFGHGLGTSREANFHAYGRDQPSHVLWTETWQEIGVIGLILFLLYLKSMISNFREAGRIVRANLKESDFLFRCLQAMQVWLLMNILFSFASYGLKSYEWYFFGGLSVVVYKLANKITADKDGSEHGGIKKVVEKYPLARRIRGQ
ncbi:MAG: hypothetical protein CL581_16035 [Alteromonadaceae bacterium]|nr:hypothetical protein [Alteromonadaceae bacterium]MBH87340.1 hypothetical protein [Alteromonadaceae bacterium]|tara:strand:- start:30632 stop:31972 length:1341 start_codon:yes stop_codon:yes gene_type:complete